MIIKKTMSANRNEFFRSLAHFAPGRSFDHSETSFHFPLDQGAATISFATLPDRQVTGLLSLPQMEVSIAFDGVEPDAQGAFMYDFDLAFRRGGG